MRVMGDRVRLWRAWRSTNMHASGKRRRAQERENQYLPTALFGALHHNKRNNRQRDQGEHRGQKGSARHG